MLPYQQKEQTTIDTIIHKRNKIFIHLPEFLILKYCNVFFNCVLFILIL